MFSSEFSIKLKKIYICLKNFLHKTCRFFVAAWIAKGVKLKIYKNSQLVNPTVGNFL